MSMKKLMQHRRAAAEHGDKPMMKPDAMMMSKAEMESEMDRMPMPKMPKKRNMKGMRD